MDRMTALRDLAEYMADFFSEDAAQWPIPEGRGRSGAPIRVTFRWFGSFVPDLGRQLLEHLAAILATPYSAPEVHRAVALVYVPALQDADIEIVLADVSQAGDPGVAYEIRFRGLDEYFPGWFALPDG